MPVTILIPTPLRRFVGGSTSLEVVAETVQGALTTLGDRSPELHRQLFDDQGQLRSFVNVFLGNAHVRILSPGQAVPVREGDVLTLLLAIAGGAPPADDLRR
jgi:molybdopterin converting factor small subunit